MDPVLEKVNNKERISKADIIHLFNLKGDEIFDLFKLANKLNEKLHGNEVSFVINRNINFTNVCQFNCKFCAFHVSPDDESAFLLNSGEIRQKVAEALKIEPECSEICIQGGLHPDLTLELIESYLHSIKEVSPSMHIHGFSPQEIWNLSRREKMSIGEILTRLKASGLNSMPGTAAEILVDDIRREICPSKVRVEQWGKIIKTAHNIGLPSTSTIMYGHIESLNDIADHMEVIRNIQEATGGFTEFVPLPFMQDGNPLGDKMEFYQTASGILDMKLHAIARLFFMDSIDNIQCSWVKLGVKFCQFLLYVGVNDFSGTLMEENISRMAGASHGEYIDSNRMKTIIRSAGKTPVQRSTTYQILARY